MRTGRNSPYKIDVKRQLQCNYNIYEEKNQELFTEDIIF